LEDEDKDNKKGVRIRFKVRVKTRVRVRVSMTLSDNTEITYLTLQKKFAILPFCFKPKNCFPIFINFLCVCG